MKIIRYQTATGEQGYGHQIADGSVNQLKRIGAKMAEHLLRVNAGGKIFLVGTKNIYCIGKAKGN